MVGGILNLLEFPWKILPDGGVVVGVLGVGPRQLEVDICSGDGVSGEGDDDLDIVPAGQDELVRTRMITLLHVQISNSDWELVGTLLNNLNHH